MLLSQRSTIRENNLLGGCGSLAHEPIERREWVMIRENYFSVIENDVVTHVKPRGQNGSDGLYTIG